MQAAVQEALPLSTRPVHVFGGSFHPRCSNRSAIGLPWLPGRWPLANTASGTYRVGLAADQAGQELLHTEVLSCVSARRSQLPQKSPGLEDSVMPVMCQGQACRAAPSQRKKTEATLAPPRWGRLAG